MSKLIEFRAKILQAREALRRLGDIRDQYQKSQNHFEAGLCQSAIDACRKACDATDKLLDSRKLELANDDTYTISTMKMFEAFMSVANFYLHTRHEPSAVAQ